jgi:two-component system CheB/CheR fusion protein
MLSVEGITVRGYSTPEEFLEVYRPGRDGCVLLDADLPRMGALELLQHLRDAHDPTPKIVIARAGDASIAVEAMRCGAWDVIEWDYDLLSLRAKIGRAIEQSRDANERLASQRSSRTRIACLTARQRQVMKMMLAGHPNKNIAADLGISQRSVENHRAAVMKKTGASSLPALARMAFAAEKSACEFGSSISSG